LHGRGGEDGAIQRQLEKHNIAYTGSNANASEQCINNAKTKDIWKQHDLALSPWVIANARQVIPEIDFPLPWAVKPILELRFYGLLNVFNEIFNIICSSIVLVGNKVGMFAGYASTRQVIPEIDFPLPWAVKPILEGSSVGISKVENMSQLKPALKLAFKYDNTALIEKWIEGNEYTVSILNGKPLPVVQIKVDQGFYDYQSKYLSDTTQYLSPCGISNAELFLCFRVS
jgi:D-alanine-D-alanine ligase